MPKISKEIASFITDHMVEIAHGRLNLTEEEIMQEEDEGLQEIMYGLFHLHEELEYNKSEASKVMTLTRSNQQIQEQILESEKRRIKELEAKQVQLKTQKEELERAYKELENFTHITSHDLQEPLVTISSIATVLEEDYYEKFDDDGKRYLEFLISSANRLRSQILAIMEYSRLGAEEATESFFPKPIIKTIGEELILMFKGQNVDMEMANLPEEIHGHPRELRLLFQILIINAIKYNDAPYKKVLINSRETSSHHFFSITDNGIGIKEEHQEQIFNMFRSLEKKKGGTGIGLSKCRKIVEKHSGKLWVESTFGQGSTFFFTIAKIKDSE